MPGFARVNLVGHDPLTLQSSPFSLMTRRTIQSAALAFLWVCASALAAPASAPHAAACVAALKAEEAQLAETSVKAPSEKQSKTGSSKKAEPAKPSPPKEQKAFLEWISEYVQCLDEVSNNIENFSTVKCGS